MAAATDGDEQLVGAGETYGLHHVRCAATARDECRATVEGSVPDPARAIVPALAREQQLTAQARTQIHDIGARQNRLLAVAANDRQFSGHLRSSRQHPLNGTALSEARASAEVQNCRLFIIRFPRA